MQKLNSGRTSPRTGNESRNASATKRGPGRYHKAVSKTSPPKQRGAGVGFVLHKASEERKERRNMIKTYGRRQGLKAIKYWRSGKPFFDIAADEPLEA